MTELSATAAPLTDAETRAGLWAIRGVLDLARQAAADRAAHDDLADVLTAAEALTALMLRPAGGNRDRFRDTLERLAGRHPGYAPVLAEFDRLTGRGRRLVRAFHPDEDPWRDCGASD